MALVEVRVPDIGDFDSVEIIEVLVAVGEELQKEDSLISLESDKATMEIPSPHAGVVKELKVAVGDKVSQGDLILLLEAAEAVAVAPAEKAAATSAPTTASKPAAAPASAVAPAAPVAAAPVAVAAVSALPIPAGVDVEADVLVLGSGPGGYTAAFRAADLGKRVVMVERHASIGGVCLNVGCIPSKALLHTAEVLNETREMSAHGVTFAEPDVDRDKLRDWKDGVIQRLTGGLAALAKQRKVTVIQGEGRFTGPQTLVVQTADGEQSVGFASAIIAAGSRPVEIPSWPHDDPRVWDSTDALRLNEIPQRLLVVGGGIIGLEMATVYDALGSKITVVEPGKQVIAAADADIIRPYQKKITSRYENVHTETKVVGMAAQKAGIEVTFEGKFSGTDTFDAVLVAVGRSPNGKLIDAEKAGVNVDERGFIATDMQMRTNVSHIFAIGDIVGQPMLAHKATHEAKVAAEVICGHDKVVFDPRTIPSVAYTDPEIAWAGLTEAEAKEQGIEFEKGSFPWAASGRSLSMGRDEGITKALFEKGTGRLIGAAMIGPNAGELIAEAVLGIEMGADMQDIGLSIHPHPTLSETLCFAAEMAEGTITDLMPPRKR
jgi:dihydrolipoamide dehydrogenase